jgi:hypothetical protein
VVTNQQLQDELARYPGHLPVRVVMREVYVCNDQVGELRFDMDSSDASEADDVRFEGAYILIEGP